MMCAYDMHFFAMHCNDLGLPTPSFVSLQTVSKICKCNTLSTKKQFGSMLDLTVHTTMSSDDMSISSHDIENPASLRWRGRLRMNVGISTKLFPSIQVLEASLKLYLVGC